MFCIKNTFNHQSFSVTLGRPWPHPRRNWTIFLIIYWSWCSFNILTYPVQSHFCFHFLQTKCTCSIFTLSRVTFVSTFCKPSAPVQSLLFPKWNLATNMTNLDLTNNHKWHQWGIYFTLEYKFCIKFFVHEGKGGMEGDGYDQGDEIVNKLFTWNFEVYSLFFDVVAGFFFQMHSVLVAFSINFGYLSSIENILSPFFVSHASPNQSPNSVATCFFAHFYCCCSASNTLLIAAWDSINNKDVSKKFQNNKLVLSHTQSLCLNVLNENSPSPVSFMCMKKIQNTCFMSTAKQYKRGIHSLLHEEPHMGEYILQERGTTSEIYWIHPKNWMDTLWKQVHISQVRFLRGEQKIGWIRCGNKFTFLRLDFWGGSNIWNVMTHIFYLGGYAVGTHSYPVFFFLFSSWCAQPKNHVSPCLYTKMNDKKHYPTVGKTCILMAFIIALVLSEHEWTVLSWRQNFLLVFFFLSWKP